MQVGEVITSPGPDTTSTCASELGRILELNKEYMAGVGGPCSAFSEWEPLSKFTEEDLRYLRGDMNGGGGTTNGTTDGGGNNTFVGGSASIYSSVAATVTLMLAGILIWSCSMCYFASAYVLTVGL